MIEAKEGPESGAEHTIETSQLEAHQRGQAEMASGAWKEARAVAVPNVARLTAQCRSRAAWLGRRRTSVRLFDSDLPLDIGERWKTSPFTPSSIGCQTVNVASSGVSIW